MRIKLLLLLLGLVLIAALITHQRQGKVSQNPNPSLAAVHTSLPITVHMIEYVGKTINQGHCSATAIGPHAIITASHCEQPSDNLAIDKFPVKIVRVMRDDRDHTIILFTGATFKFWSDFKSRDDITPLEEIVLCGNPGDLTKVFRRGYIAGMRINDVGLPMLLFDVNGFYGDSGAGIFDKDGNLIAIVSKIYGEAGGGNYMKFMESYLVRFTPEDFKTAREF